LSAGKAEGSEAKGAPREPLNLIRGLPIVDQDQRLVGIVTQGDLLRSIENDPSGAATVLEAGSDHPIVAYPDELVFDALERMVQNNVGRLPVVGRKDPTRMVGYFNRSSLLGAWNRQFEEESVREHGWLADWRGASSRRL
jgi:CIC family chloride channel protein